MRDVVIADCELTTGEIAALTGARLRAGDPADRPICNIAPLDTAGPSDISFLENSKYVGELATTRAGACLIAPRFAGPAPRSLVVLETPQPYPSFVAVSRKLFGNLLRPCRCSGQPAALLVRRSMQVRASKRASHWTRWRSWARALRSVRAP